MPISIAAATNYPSPLVALPSTNQDEPIEGRHVIPVELIWNTMGGATKTVDINCQNNATLAFSQISSLKVDNSQCSVALTIIFNDTNELIVIPPMARLVVIPVFTNAKEFTVTATGAIAADVSRLKVFNHPVLPVFIQ